MKKIELCKTIDKQYMNTQSHTTAFVLDTLDCVP